MNLKINKLILIVVLVTVSLPQAYTAAAAASAGIGTIESELMAYDDGSILVGRAIKGSSDASGWLLLRKDQKQIGVISLMSDTFFGQSFLCNFFINKEFRQQGYGTKLLKAALEALAKKGIKNIYLDANPYEKNEDGILAVLPAGDVRRWHLQKLIKFYESHGFIGVDAARSYFFRMSASSYPMQYAP